MNIGAKVTVAMIVGFIFSQVASFAEIVGSVSMHDRVGNGWHMNTTVTVHDNGRVDGVTKLRNYNNFRGFTGGLRLAVVGNDGSPIYVSKLHQWGINAAFFRKKRVRTASWSETIPMEYLKEGISISMVQEHSPTKRVWKWIYDNREKIIDNAMNFIDIVIKIQKKEPITEEDIWNATGDVVALLKEVNSDAWFLDNIQGIYDVAEQLHQLAQKEKDGWVPENYDDAKALVMEVVELTQKPWDWENMAELEQMVKEVIALVHDQQGWVPENLTDVEVIVGQIYELANDERIPWQIKENLRGILHQLEQLNG